MKKDVQAIKEVIGSLQLDNLQVSKPVLNDAVRKVIRKEPQLRRERGKNDRRV